MKQIQESVLDDILLSHVVEIVSELQKAGFKLIDENDLEEVEGEIFNVLDSGIRKNVLVEGQLVSNR